MLSSATTTWTLLGWRRAAENSTAAALRLEYRIFIVVDVERGTELLLVGPCHGQIMVNTGQYHCHCGSDAEGAPWFGLCWICALVKMRTFCNSSHVGDPLRLSVDKRSLLTLFPQPHSCCCLWYQIQRPKATTMTSAVTYYIQFNMMFIRPATQAYFRQAANSCSTIATVARGGTRRAIVVTAPALPSTASVGTSTSSSRRGFADATTGSPWEKFTMAPPDPIIGLTEVCLFTLLYFPRKQHILNVTLISNAHQIS